MKNIQKQIADIVRRAKQTPNYQEFWQLNKDGGCIQCGGSGTMSVLACGNSCRNIDHRWCGTKSVHCPVCAGTGLGVMALFRLLKDVGHIVGITIKLPSRQHLKD